MDWDNPDDRLMEIPSEDGYKRLLVEIVRQAVNDYVLGIKHGDSAKVIDCIRFFLSGWCNAILGEIELPLATGRDVMDYLDNQHFDADEWQKQRRKAQVRAKELKGYLTRRFNHTYHKKSKTQNIMG